MTTNKYIKPIVVSAICLFMLKLLFDRAVPNYAFEGWEHGASGYYLAVEQVKAAEKPLILYFHTNWCGWCKEMNKNYLAAYEVEEFLRDIPKVEINPDKGKDEKALFKEFGLTGYPSFFVFIPELSSKPVERIYPYPKKWGPDCCRVSG